MGEPLLQIDGLSVRIKAFDILSDVSLRVDAGVAVGLVGETGSGKTMTVRAACGLLARSGARIVDGTVKVEGRDLTRGSQREWRSVRGTTLALIPQSSMSGLDPVMTIGGQLRETVRMLKGFSGSQAQAEVKRLLEAVRLGPSPRLLAAYAHELSGGMRQRVMIALALAGDPRLIVADEPTTALDATIQSEIVALLGDLQRERDLGMLVVSHDIGLIEAMTTLIAVMYGGRVVEIGPTSSVLEHPAHPYTRALLAALPERALPGEPLVALAGQPPAPSDSVVGCRFAPRCPDVAEACWADEPRLVSVGPGHEVACVVHAGERNPMSPSGARGHG
jgi:peptide/nickel transport system ATP-binding protein